MHASDLGDSPRDPSAPPGAGWALPILESACADLIRTGGVLLSHGPLSPGPWSVTLAATFQYLLPRVKRDLPSTQPAPRWALWLEGSWPVLARADLETVDHAPIAFLIPGVTSLPFPLLWALRRDEAAQVWTLQADAWSITSMRAALGDHLYERRLRPILRRFLPALPLDESAAREGLKRLARAAQSECPRRTSELTGLQRWSEFLAGQGSVALNCTSQRPAAAHTNPRPALRVAMYIGSLSPGGAERQFCNLAIGLQQRGHEVCAVTAYPPEGDSGHYTRLLSHAGIPVRTADSAGLLTRAESDRIRWDLLAALPGQIRTHATSLAFELARVQPDIVHAWLDHPNLIGGCAALAASDAQILLSTRNMNPTNFPRLHAPYMRTWYAALARSPRVHWLANSHAGARSYANWLSMDESRHHVVLNGLFADHFSRPTHAQRMAARSALGIDANRPVVAVINRLSEEKQPDLMLKVVSLLSCDLPDLLVLVAGQGPLEDHVRAAIKRHRLDERIRLLGRVEDVTQVLMAAECLLLTSTLEGCPNVALEAQHMGVPVVATAGGGTVDAVLHGRTGFLCKVGDAVGLARALRRLILDEPLRERMGAAAMRFVDESFSVDRMIDLTQQVYAEMLGRSSTRQPRRIVTPRIESAAPRERDLSLPEIMVRRLTPRPGALAATPARNGDI